MNSEADASVRIEALNAASRSVRYFDNYCTEAQARQLVKIVAAAASGGDHKLNEAAAQLLGTMNLPTPKKPELIQSTDALD